MISIVVADDHPVVLTGIVALLNSQVGFEVRGQATDVPQLIRLIEEHKPDIVVTDYQMPGPDGGDGANLMRTLQRRFPDVKIIVLTMLENPMLLRLAVKLGARGVLAKRSNNSDLLHAIRIVASGSTYMPPEVREGLDAYVSSNIGYGDALSPREIEVVRLFAEGLTVSAIAESLSRSRKTISHQKRSAMEKLGVKTDQDLVQYVIAHGLK